MFSLESVSPRHLNIIFSPIRLFYSNILEDIRLVGSHQCQRYLSWKKQSKKTSIVVVVNLMPTLYKMSVLLNNTLYLRNTEKKLLRLTPQIISPVMVLVSFLRFNFLVVDTYDETFATATTIEQFEKSSNIYEYHTQTHRQKMNS